MFRIIALSLALAATAGVAGAQAAKTTSKSTVQTSAAKKRVHHARAKKVETQAELQAEAKISLATARATALKEVPNGTVKSSELEREHGKLVYSFDISVPGKSGIEEVAVSAVDGSVVSRQHETAAMEKKEAAEEAKEKKAKK
ncbi:MAG TPA: PepSY domain-containing protein [Gemmatimonadaceae bacterium]|nr:PepSY domain-containing protein [Gemmatimonadaceae bacterium]